MDPNYNAKLSSILNTHLGEEISAWYTYWILYQVSKGKAYRSLSKVFEENAEDELNDHAEKLITWMQANNVAVEVNLIRLVSLAKGGASIPSNMSDGWSTEQAVIAAIKSERHAIQGYRDSYKVVVNEYPDLAHMLMDISNDEEEHLNDVLDLANQIGIDSSVIDGSSISGVANFGKIVDKVFSENKTEEDENFTKESEALRKHQEQYGPKSELDKTQLIKRNDLLDASREKSHLIENTVAQLEFSERIQNSINKMKNFSEVVVITYRDEDGEDTAEFKSDDEADKWIETQESRKSSGEKFDVIKRDYIAKFSQFRKYTPDEIIKQLADTSLDEDMISSSLKKRKTTNDKLVTLWKNKAKDTQGDVEYYDVVVSDLISGSIVAQDETSTMDNAEKSFNIFVEQCKSGRFNFSEDENWVDDVETKWEPPEGLFESGSADEIAKEEKKGHKDLRSAMSSLNFYLNRGGDNIPEDRRKVIEEAKDKLRELYGKD